MSFRDFPFLKPGNKWWLFEDFSATRVIPDRAAVVGQGDQE